MEDGWMASPIDHSHQPLAISHDAGVQFRRASGEATGAKSAAHYN
jgi:hypothetical protein